MKKFLIIFGYIVLFFICIGSFFKLMHWPGAGPILVMGMTLLAGFFVPAFFVERMIENKSGLNIAVNIFGMISIASIFMGTLFKVMHWPGAGPMLLLGSLLFIFPTLILYVVQQFKEYDRKFSEYWRMVFLVVFVSIFFYLFGYNYSRNIVETYVKIEDGVLVTNQNINDLNDLLYSSIENRAELGSDSIKKFLNIAKAVRQKSKEMLVFIEDAKTQLISSATGMRVDPTFSHWNINVKDNYDIPTYIIGLSESAMGKQMEELLKSYNQDIKGLFEYSGTPIEKEKWQPYLTGVNMKINDQMDLDMNVSWHESMFYNTPLSGTLALLTNVQNEILNTETKALFILSKSFK